MIGSAYTRDGEAPARLSVPASPAAAGPAATARRRAPRLRWILALAAALAVVAVAAIRLYPEAVVLRWNDFVDRQARLSFSYPDNWAPIAAADLPRFNRRARLGLVKADSENTSFVVRIDAQPGKVRLDLERSVAGLRHLLASRLDDFRLGYIRPRDFKGIPALEARYEHSIYTAPGEWSKLRLAQKQIVFLHEQKLYWLMFSALPQDFERDSGQLERILDTLEIAR